MCSCSGFTGVKTVS